MTLIIGDRIDDDLSDARWRATDSVANKPVGVRISHEALKDKGESACLQKARDKYDGSSSAVRVTTSDF